MLGKKRSLKVCLNTGGLRIHMRIHETTYQSQKKHSQARDTKEHLKLSLKRKTISINAKVTYAGNIKSCSTCGTMILSSNFARHPKTCTKSEPTNQVEARIYRANIRVKIAKDKYPQTI